MKKAVVFGGSGFLGSYVADELTRRNYAVVIADTVKPKSLADGQRYVLCDIMDPDQAVSAIGDASFVYNFAGMADLDESFNLPRETMELNVIGNINVLEAAVKAKVERFVFASSAYALSIRGGFYGISKHTSERIVREYSNRHGLLFTVIRYGSLYGERADGHNGIYRLLHQALTSGRIMHKGDGEEIREYIHAVDASRLSVDVIEDPQYQNEHVVLTGAERLKQKDILLMISEIMNDQVEVIFTRDAWEGHYKVTPYSFHPELGKKLFANPFIDLGQGIVSCIQHLRETMNQADEE